MCSQNCYINTYKNTKSYIKEYGNIKLNELPANELQQLQELISNMNIKNAICLEDTMQMALDKVKMPEQMMQILNVVEKEA